MPFAAPGRRGPLFAYGGPHRQGARRGGTVLEGPFAVVDVETTGFSPSQGDRVIEIAVARVDARGVIEEEYATLLNPQGRSTGAVFIHGISDDAVRDAPAFSDVLGDVLALLEGAVVVAHNAVFEERFLSAELERAGVKVPTLPALCTLWLAQQTVDAPNHKLATLGRRAGLPMHDAHAALGDVRTVAALLPGMLHDHGGPLAYGVDVQAQLGGGARGLTNPRTRAAGLRRGTDGWMASLLSRLPATGAEADDAMAADYLGALAVALEDGKIVGEEARLLAKLAGRAGMGARQVAELNERFLETLRAGVFDDGVVTRDELQQLKTAAAGLGVPRYFDDVVVIDPTATTVRTTLQEPVLRPATTRRCGHCRQPGHYRPRCPQLT